MRGRFRCRRCRRRRHRHRHHDRQPHRRRLAIAIGIFIAIVISTAVGLALRYTSTYKRKYVLPWRIHMNTYACAASPMGICMRICTRRYTRIQNRLVYVDSLGVCMQLNLCRPNKRHEDVLYKSTHMCAYTFVRVHTRMCTQYDVCMTAPICVSIRACTCLHLHIYSYARVCICRQVGMCVWMYVHTCVRHNLRMHTCTCNFLHAHVYVCEQCYEDIYAIVLTSLSLYFHADVLGTRTTHTLVYTCAVVYGNMLSAMHTCTDHHRPL